MTIAKIHYDKDVDVLYVAFGQSEHVTGVELADNILLRLDTGKATGNLPRAIGLTFVNFSHMMDHHRDKPLTISLDQLRDLPEDLWQAVIDVVTTSPVRDVLEVGLSVAPQMPPLPVPANAVQFDDQVARARPETSVAARHAGTRALPSINAYLKFNPRRQDEWTVSLRSKR